MKLWTCPHCGHEAPYEDCYNAEAVAPECPACNWPDAIMRDWRYSPDYNYVTAIDNGNCRVPITDHIYGQSDEQILAHGKLMAAAPNMLQLLSRLCPAGGAPAHIVQHFGPDCMAIYSETRRLIEGIRR